MKDLTLCGHIVRVNDDGFVSLTDMWKASGSKRAKEPRKFLKLNKTKALISAIKNNTNQKIYSSARGRYGGGTWAIKRIALEYKKWCNGLDIGNYGNCLIEKGALNAIEQLHKIKLYKQYKVDSYYIDGYHKETNTAYEIDEPHHYINGKLNLSCQKRQKFIEDKLGCQFVRIKV